MNCKYTVLINKSRVFFKIMSLSSDHTNAKHFGNCFFKTVFIIIHIRNFMGVLGEIVQIQH